MKECALPDKPSIVKFFNATRTNGNSVVSSYWYTNGLLSLMLYYRANMVILYLWSEIRDEPVREQNFGDMAQCEKAIAAAIATAVSREPAFQELTRV